MLRRREVLWGLLMLLMPRLVRAEHYLDFDEAARVLFPDADGFASVTAELDGAARKRIKSESGMRVRGSRVEGITAQRAGETIGWVYLDEVIGKHEFITYAVGIDAERAVRGIEILDYRETKGGAVREAKWRVQFRGKTSDDPLRLGKDIQNISGATLSCRNLTDGVRRLLATHAVLGR
jgi:Na+-translocating ferredoxin:NAD+ oxidoreductase RnfG subunit